MQIGSTVTLTYKGTLEDGSVFGYADADKPMTFQTGMEQAIDGFEKAILEMSEEGEKRTFTVGMYDAYGEYRDDFTDKIPVEALAMGVKPGKRIWIWGENGEKLPCTVIVVDDKFVTIDQNHPLAGHDLTFEVEILKIEDAPEDFVSEAERRKERERLTGMLSNGF
ncbi:MAG: FKBP-type peptidyl-prolyl cis-trans isomerase [Coriobacteriales bacterium]|nr:FKBP-type peptidyl-prolyl cis-trans isomerase [Coriobacteriales bacterium]